MKKTAIIAAVVGCLLIYSNCSKEVISRTEEFTALDPAQPDTAARNWKTILLAKPDEFLIGAPGVITSSDYLAEVNEILGLQANMTEEQKRSVNFWSAGAVLRWNEIMRELVAKHNLPPYQNEDGTYSAPNAANPFAYPNFPFSNPPYAARAYGYISAAQHDALIAAYFYKNKYPRLSPNKTNSQVTLMVPASQVIGSSYPSAEAAVYGVTVELMKLLFPTEIGYVQQKAYEHKMARIMSGASTRSDMDAGEQLGKLVASKFVARAKGDKAGKAIGDAALWASLEKTTADKGEMPWISRELPLRPPMLPKFGAVKGFLMDSAAVVNNRPGPPPSTSSSQFQAELDEVLWYSQHATVERMKIVHFWADGVGTYTPPGHWNAIACEDFVNEHYSEVRWARNLALLNMAMMDAAICCWDAKYAYFNPRPSQANPKIKTLTGVPNFPAYTSGHSTFSGAAATILGHIVPAQAGKYSEYATQASLSRLYGAIHYRSDCEVGLQMGNKIGQKAIDRAVIDGAE